MRHFSDDERRARLATRHAVARTSRVATPEAATRAMTVLHATEPATVHLSCWARTDDVSVADVERALYEERTIVKQLAMRRTLFVFPRDLLPAAWGSASARVAVAQRSRLAQEVVRAGIADDGEAWIAEVMADALAHLADHQPRQAQQVREEVPSLSGRLELSPGTRYATTVSVAPRVLAQLAVEARIVRADNAGNWRTNRPRWTPMDAWLPEVPDPLDERAGYAEIVRRWLRTFGPGTATDLQWWLGGTKGAVTRALVDVEAVEVSLDGGSTGWVLPDDVDEVPDGSGPEPWAALLPVLDATVMGWKQRDFYLGPHAPDLFDRNGNAGTTAWVDGRVVGCWVQDDDAVVHVHPLEDVAAGARRRLDAEAARLTEWLDGVRVGTVYPSPAMKAARATISA